MVGRPGVAFVSISFPDGTFRGAHLDAERTIEVQESHADAGTATWFDGRRRPARPEAQREDQLRSAARAGSTSSPRRRARARGPSRTRSSRATRPASRAPSRCSMRSARSRAVLTVDFDVGALSDFVARPALDQARSVVYTRDGAILAYAARDEARASPATSCCATTTSTIRRSTRCSRAAQPIALRLSRARRPATAAYLASVAPIGGKRAGVAVPLDWYVATRRAVAHAARADPSRSSVGGVIASARRARDRRRRSRSCSRGTWCACARQVAASRDRGAHRAKRAPASSAATGSSRGSAPAAWARCGAPSIGCSRARRRSS